LEGKKEKNSLPVRIRPGKASQGTPQWKDFMKGEWTTDEDESDVEEGAYKPDEVDTDEE